MYRGKVILMEEFDKSSSLVDSFKEENSEEIHKERNRSLTVAQIEQNK